MINVYNMPFQSADFRNYDTVIYDPPYNVGYGEVPHKNNLKTMIVAASPVTIFSALLGCRDAGWNNFLHLITWDCVSSWYTPGRILMRTNLFAVFSDNKYDNSKAELKDGIHRPSRATKNSRGAYLSKAKDSAQLSTYTQMRSRMLKTHAHEKPTELIRAILAPLSPVSVIDCFGGSGSCAIAASEFSERVDVFETSKEFCELIAKNVEQSMKAASETVT